MTEHASKRQQRRGGIAPRTRKRRLRSMTEIVGSIVLGSETLIVGLAGLAIYGLRILPPGLTLVLGVLVLLLMFVGVGLMRFPVGRWIGWLCHVLILAGGLLHWGLFVVGGVFFAVWIYGMVQASQIDRMRAPIIEEHRRLIREGVIAEDTPITVPELADSLAARQAGENPVKPNASTQ